LVELGVRQPFRTGVLIPTYHPAAALRGGGKVVAQIRADLVRAKMAMAATTAPADPDQDPTAAPGGPPGEAPGGTARTLFG